MNLKLSQKCAIIACEHFNKFVAVAADFTHFSLSFMDYYHQTGFQLCANSLHLFLFAFRFNTQKDTQQAAKPLQYDNFSHRMDKSVDPTHLKLQPMSHDET